METKTTKEKKTLEVFITKGMRHGERITFNGEADEAPDTTPGDVVVVLQQAEHATFKREANSLYCKKVITLVEALTGFRFYLPHLDGRVLDVRSDPTVVYTPGTVKAVTNEGMPQKSNPYIKGNLYIEIDVKFPDKVSDAKKTDLIKVLGAPAIEKTPVVKRKEVKANDEGMEVETEVDDVPEEVKLVDVDMEAERAARAAEGQHREQYEEDEDGGRRGGQPGCRAQ